jgi:hypothetical protein
MTRQTSRCLQTLAAFALVAASSTVVSAQTVPQQTDQSGATVREILGRAETESRRRSIGDILGGIAGISRAEAQAAPATPPGSPAAASGSPSPISVAQSTSAPPAAAPVATAVSSSGPSTVPSGGTGTPADPTMIVTVPDNPPVQSSGGVAQAGNGVTEAAAAPASVPAGGPSRVSPAISTSVGAERRSSAVVTAGGPRHAVRTHGYVPGRDWCPPGRW